MTLALAVLLTLALLLGQSTSSEAAPGDRTEEAYPSFGRFAVTSTSSAWTEQPTARPPLGATVLGQTNGFMLTKERLDLG